MFEYSLYRDLDGGAYLIRLRDDKLLEFDGEDAAKVLQEFDALEDAMPDRGYTWYAKEFNTLAASYF